MKPIKFKNVNGETIEVKRGKKKGIINIRHSDVDPKKFGQYHEYADRIRQPDTTKFFREKGLDPDEAVKVLRGGFMLLHYRHYLLSADEVMMIRAAIKQLG